MDGNADFTTYEKRPGTSDSGKDYEYLMCAFYALKLCIQNDIKDFVIAANRKNFGDFDDVVLEITFEDNVTKMFALQLKHKENVKNLTDVHFASNSNRNKNRGFGLLKYLETFENNEKMDNVVCVLYSNASTNIQNEQRFQISTESPENQFDVAVSENNDADLIQLLGNFCHAGKQNIFQFKINQKQTQFKRIEIFSKQFYFFPNQAKSTVVRSRIDEMLEQLVLGDISNSFLHFMKTWGSGTFILTKDDVISKLAQLSLSPWTKILNANNQNTKTEQIKEAIMNFDVTIVETNTKNIVETIWIESENQNEQIGKATAKYGLTVVDKQKSVALWYLNLVPLVVEVREENKILIINSLNLLKKCPKMKHVVLIGTILKEELLNFNVFENLADLSNNALLKNQYQFIVENLQMSIQEKPIISLKAITEGNLNIMAAISTDYLLEMSQGDLCIGCRDGDLPEFYVSRIATGIFLDTEKTLEHFNSTDDCVVIFNCDDDTEKYLKSKTTAVELSQYLADNCSLDKTIVFINGTCSAIDFENVCEKKSDVYLVKIIDEFCSRLLFKKGSKSSQNDVKLERIEQIEENEILSYFNSDLNIICAPPGMGKSLLFTHLSQITPSDIWTVRVNLIQYNTFFKKTKNINNEEILNKFLKINDDRFFMRLKNAFLENKKIVIFLDGLDEIDGKFIDIVLGFAKYASSQGIRVWISSREHLKQQISDNLKVLPIDIQELNDEQQRSFITERLKDKYEGVEIELITEAVFASSDLINSRQLLGVPLQLYIITENFIYHDKMFSNLNAPDVFVLTTMYRNFFEGKRTFYEHKFDVDLNQMGISFAQILRQYELPAIECCLEYNDFKKLELNEEKHLDFMLRIKTHGDKFGIVQTVSEENITIFVHQTFAEYFACVWFTNNTDKLFLLRDQMFSGRYKNLRLILDIMLAENNPLHLAVIYKNVAYLKEHIDDVDSKDSGGRSLLHLACSYGDAFADFPGYYWYDLQISRTHSNSIEILKLLFEQPSNVFEIDNIFQMNSVEYAVKSHYFDPLELMLEKHLLEYDELFRLLTLDSHEPLAFCASKLGYVNLLDVLFKHNYKDTFLIGAIEGCKIEEDSSLDVINLIVEAVVKYRNNQPKKNKRPDEYILEKACQCENMNMIKGLVDCGLKCAHHKTILHYISRWKSNITEKCIEVLNLRSINVNHKNDLGLTALHVACRSGIIYNVKVLLDLGADVALVDNECNTVLHAAVLHKDIEVLDYLLQYSGIDVNTTNNGGQTPLHVACGCKPIEIVQKLLEHGSDLSVIDKKGNSAMHCAAQHKSRDEILHYLLEFREPNFNLANDAGETILLLACKYRSVEIVKKLIDSGTDVDVRDNDGNTLIHCAITNLYYKDELLSYLIELRTLDVNAQNQRGETALHLACRSESVKIVKELIENGGDANISDKDGNTALYYAKYNWRSEVLDYLSAYAAQNFSIVKTAKEFYKKLLKN